MVMLTDEQRQALTQQVRGMNLESHEEEIEELLLGKLAPAYSLALMGMAYRNGFVQGAANAARKGQGLSLTEKNALDGIQSTLRQSKVADSAGKCAKKEGRIWKRQVTEQS